MAWINISKLYSKQCKSDTVSYLKARIEYIVNDEKTNNQKYVNSYKCEFDTAHILFEELKANYLAKTGRKQQEDVVAYRVLQSFKGYETTPEIANKIGYELAMKLTNGNHAFVVATHIDTENIHNHIT